MKKQEEEIGEEILLDRTGPLSRENNNGALSLLNRSLLPRTAVAGFNHLLSRGVKCS